MNVRPFTIWGLPIETLVEIAQGKFVIVSAFDVASFVWLARQCGLPMRFSSFAEATQQAQRFGSAQHLPTWGGRALVHEVGEALSFIASGAMSRFINDLVNPLPFLIHDAREAGVFREPPL